MSIEKSNTGNMPASGNFLEKYGPQLLALGYDLVPIAPSTKAPRIKGWQNIQATLEKISEWSSSHSGCGIRGPFTVGVDLDIYDTSLTKHMLTFAHEKIGKAPYRVGKHPKALLPYRCEIPFKKISSSKFQSPDGKEHRIEILADGQQFVTAHKGEEISLDLKSHHFFTREAREQGFTCEMYIEIMIDGLIACPGLNAMGLGLGSYGHRLNFEERADMLADNQFEFFLPWGEEGFWASVKFLQSVKKTQSINNSITSYGLKHRVEKWSEKPDGSQTYVFNGSFIAAAIYLGFCWKPEDINALFNMSKKMPLHESGQMF